MKCLLADLSDKMIFPEASLTMMNLIILMEFVKPHAVVPHS